jgi:hypothetical protein
MPAAEASQCVEATIPNVPRSSGRVVNATRLLEPNCGVRPRPRSGPVEGVWGNREVPPATESYPGLMFWLTWKTLSGSYSAFTFARRS